LHRRGVAGGKGLAANLVDLLLQLCDSRSGLAANLVDLLLQLCDSRSGHCSASSVTPRQAVARF
jgi:hypothetical protein